MEETKKLAYRELSKISTIESASEYLIASKALEIYYKDVESRIEKLKEMQQVQHDNITDDYMQGLYNGIEYALTFFTCKEPDFIDIKGVKDSEKMYEEYLDGHK